MSTALKYFLIFFISSLVNIGLSAKKYEHLPYALRRRFSLESGLKQRSLASTEVEDEARATSPASSTKSSLFVTHHIDDIESFFNQNNGHKAPATTHHRHRHHYQHHKHRHHNMRHSNGSSIMEHQRSHHHQMGGSVSSLKRTIKNNKEFGYESNSEYVSAIVGKDIQLDCKLKKLTNEDDKIMWLRMPKGEILTFNSNRVTTNMRMNSVCNKKLVPCWSLLITDTRESDTGFYACQTNDMKSKYVYLDIMVPPKLLTQYPLDRLDVSLNSNASITCEFYGKPEPLIKWYKYQNGKPHEIQRFRGFKTIDIFINSETPNEFECIADNSIPPIISKKMFLNIQHLPKVKFLNSRIYQKKGERVIFDCMIQANPDAKVNWYRDEVKLNESLKYYIENIDNKNYRLHVNNLADNDFGFYKCVATNELGNSTAAIELAELPSETTTTTESTTTLPSTTNFYHRNKLIKQQDMSATSSESSDIDNNKNRLRLDPNYLIKNYDLGEILSGPKLMSEASKSAAPDTIVENERENYEIKDKFRSDYNVKSNSYNLNVVTYTQTPASNNEYNPPSRERPYHRHRHRYYGRKNNSSSRIRIPKLPHLRSNRNLTRHSNNMHYGRKGYLRKNFLTSTSSSTISTSSLLAGYLIQNPVEYEESESALLDDVLISNVVQSSGANVLHGKSLLLSVYIVLFTFNQMLMLFR